MVQNNDFQKWWCNNCPAHIDKDEAEEMGRLIEAHYHESSTAITEDIVIAICSRLIEYEPIQYILGECWFYRRKFEVNRATLIPRPETEELCHFVLQEFGNNAARFLDAGTGSGCIAVTLAAERNAWVGEALDISAAALNTANRNARLHGVELRLKFTQLDLLKTTAISEDFDLIISNPPYVGLDEKEEMEKRVLNWEPEEALFPFHEDVLIFYRKLSYLLETQRVKCVLWAEINPLYATNMHLIFKHCKIVSDMYGKARFVRATNEKGA